MPDPFTIGLAVLFNGPRSMPALFTPAVGEPTIIRVIRWQAGKMASLNSGEVILDTNAVQIMRSDVAKPANGDFLEIGEEHFLIQGGPLLDAEGLTWRCELEPET